MLKCSFCLILVAAAFAADKTGKPPTQKASKPARTAKAADGEKTPFGVFKGASKTPAEPAAEAGPRKTPFGVFRNDGQEKPKAPAEPAGTGLRVVNESSDSVTFEKKSPFGPSRWQRKKSALTEDERAAWERSKTPASSGSEVRE